MPATYRPNEILQLDNHPEEWAKTIGGLLVTFGALEFTSFRWVDFLSTDKMMKDISIGIQFSRRVEVIQNLMARSDWPENLKQEAEALWAEALRISKTRNLIAHNPICSYPKADGNFEMGVLNLKEMRGLPPYRTEPLLLQEIRMAAIQLTQVFNSLNAFLSKLPQESCSPPYEN